MTRIAAFTHPGKDRPNTMPRYYFHVYDHAENPDFEGAEFSNDEAARAKAVVFMGEALKKLDGSFWPQGEWRLRVVDETGRTVCSFLVSGA